MTSIVNRPPRAESLLLPPAGARAMLSGRDGQDERMLIPVAQAQRIIAHMHGGGAGIEKVVRTRFKYLGQSGFPRKANVSRGQRASFGIEDTLKLVVAFELLALGVASQTATTCVTEEWAELRPALTGAWSREPFAAPEQIATSAGPRLTMTRDLEGWAAAETEGLRIDHGDEKGTKGDAAQPQPSAVHVHLGVAIARFAAAAIEAGGISHDELLAELDLLHRDAGDLSTRAARASGRAEAVGAA